MTTGTASPAPAPGSAEELTALLDAGDSAGIVSFFHGMSEKQRRTFVKPLRAQFRTVRWAAFSTSGPHRDWNGFSVRRNRVGKALIPAAMAVLGTPSAIAKYLRMVVRELRVEADLDAVRAVLTDRAPDWLSELPDELATEVSPEFSLKLVETVAELAGVTPTASPAFVQAWAGSYQWRPRRSDHNLLDHPRLAELLPLTFDDDANDDLFAQWADFLSAAVEAVAEGLVPRADILDASLRRLLRGGRTGAMQGQLRFWSALEPADEEVAERISSCISLLSSQNGTVAREFLAAVKKACDAGLADLELALEAASIAVTRSEKNVVKTALSWLDALAAANPDRVAEVCGHIATAFGAQGADAQERAVRLIGKRAKALGEGDRQRLVAEAEVHLAPDLAAKLAGLLGVEQDSATSDVGFPDVAPYAPRPLPPPIESPAELAEAVAALMHGDPAEAMVVERILEAFVAFERTDRAGLTAAMKPVAELHEPGWSWGVTTYPQTPRVGLYRLAQAAAGVGAGEEARRHGRRAPVYQLWPRVRQQQASYAQVRARTSPADFLILRTAEIHAALGMADLPPLVSVPTAANGIIDPRVLAARLRECESEGWVPLEADFHQALLRLPVDCGDVDGWDIDISGFTSEAGRRFAAWVGGDRVELPTVAEQDSSAPEQFRAPKGHTSFISRVPRVRVEHPESLLELVGSVWRDAERQWDGSNWDVCWPAILPGHPDLPAVALMGSTNWTMAAPSAESAVVLAELDGPAHAGTHYVIAARMVHSQAQLRASGVDAALVLASRGVLDPALLADALMERLTAEPSSLRRVVPGVRDLANGGAAGQTWETIAAMLPRLLPPAVPKAVSGSADLMVLGTELAGALKVRTPIAAVTAVAEKKGGSAVANAARRLEGVLTAAD